MNSLNNFYEPIFQTFDYKGRSNKKQFWAWFWITVVWFVLGAQLLDSWIMSVEHQVASTFPNFKYHLGGLIPTLFTVAQCATWLVAFLPLLSMTARRLRDAGADPVVFKRFLFAVIATVALSLLGLVAFVFIGLSSFAFLAAVYFGGRCLAQASKPSIELEVSNE